MGKFRAQELFFCVKDGASWEQTWVYFLLSLSLAHSSASLEQDVSHPSSQSDEHHQLLVKAILDQMVNCEQGVWMLSDSRITVERRLKMSVKTEGV